MDNQSIRTTATLNHRRTEKHFTGLLQDKLELLDIQFYIYTKYQFQLRPVNIGVVVGAITKMKFLKSSAILNSLRQLSIAHILTHMN